MIETSKIHGITINKSSPNLNPEDMGNKPYDYRIERFAKTYPYTYSTIPTNLVTWYKYGITNYAHTHRNLQTHDFSERAEELGLLPDGTAIVLHYIREVMDEYEDQIPESTGEEGDEGTIEDLIDLMEARNAVRLRVNPYLKKDIEDTDFTDIIEKFEEENTDFPEPEDGEEGEPTEEAEERRITFTDLVLTACSGNYKPDKEILEAMLDAAKVEWNPTQYATAWYIGVAAEYDSMVKRAPAAKFKGQVKQKIKIRDFDEKYRGDFALIPWFQGSKGDLKTPYGLYRYGYNGFVYLEIDETEALKKKGQMTVQICMFVVKITDPLNLYPYTYDGNTLMYDGRIKKEDITDKYVYRDDSYDRYIYDASKESFR